MKVTIYMPSEFLGNICAIEAHLTEHGRRPWAQYPARPYAHFRAKRRRHDNQVYPHSMLIVEGWGQPAPASIYGKAEVVGNAMVAEGRHSAFSGGWQADFNAMIDPLIASGRVKVVADYR